MVQMKTIVTDKGKEFINEVMGKLLKRMHIEQKSTQGYNPKANGKAERVNQTIIEILRKFCESNPLDWQKQLPYINLVCKAKISETSKFSPYELMYGIKMKKFYNWYDSKEESVEIVKRSTQIKEVVEEKSPRASENTM